MNNEEEKQKLDRITYSRINELKSKLNLDIQDINFLYGRTIDFPISDKKIEEKGDSEVESISFSVLVRAIEKEEKSIPYERLNYETVFEEIIKKYEPNAKIGYSTIYLGLGYWPANDWKRGVSKPSARIYRVFMVIKKLTDLFGKKGWDIWKQSLEEEAISRGTTFEKVLKYKTWNPEKQKSTE